ncbi:hypothetical protein [Gemmobacter denitrificans]
MPVWRHIPFKGLKPKMGKTSPARKTGKPRRGRKFCGGLSPPGPAPVTVGGASPVASAGLGETPTPDGQRGQSGLRARRAAPILAATLISEAPMQHLFRPVLHKARLQDLALHVGRSGLCLNDPCQLQTEPATGLMVHALIDRPFLGLIPRRTRVRLGCLGPRAKAYLAPHLETGARLRLRIVGLTPEHLAGPEGPEISVSVWSDQLLPAPSGQGHMR